MQTTPTCNMHQHVYSTNLYMLATIDFDIFDGYHVRVRRRTLQTIPKHAA